MAYQPLEGQTAPQQQYPQQQYAQQQPQQYAGAPVGYVPPNQQYGGQPQAQPYVIGQPQYVGSTPAPGNQTFVAVAMPNPGIAEVNTVWVAQQVDTSSCYIKILATLIIAYAIYSLAISSQSMYTTGWDIASGVLLLITGIIGLAAGITNRTNITRVYFWALVLMTLIFLLGYIIVLAIIGADPCKDVNNGSGSNSDKDASKICDYSVNTIRAVLVIGALIVLACCGCCTYCARMHLKNLELRDNNGVIRT